MVLKLSETTFDSARRETKWMIVHTETMIKIPTILQNSFTKRSFLSPGESTEVRSLILIIINTSIAINNIPPISGLIICVNKLLAISFADNATANSMLTVYFMNDTYSLCCFQKFHRRSACTIPYNCFLKQIYKSPHTH